MPPGATCSRSPMRTTKRCRDGWRASPLPRPRADLVGGALDGDALNDGMVARSIPRGDRQELPLAYGFLPFVPGGNCAVWASLARSLRWNEDYVVGGSDVEFSWRAHLAGARLGFAPGAVMRRRNPTTLRSLGLEVLRIRARRPEGLPAVPIGGHGPAAARRGGARLGVADEARPASGAQPEVPGEVAQARRRAAPDASSEASSSE